jgi:hypothetical protein
MASTVTRTNLPSTVGLHTLGTLLSRPPRPTAHRADMDGDAGVDLHVLQREAGHQDPAVTASYLHPDVQAMLDARTAFSAWWS